MQSVLKVVVRVTPQGGRDQVEGVMKNGAGDFFLKVRVKAPAQDGKANAAVEKLLADFFGVPRAQVTLLQGPKLRLKVLGVMGNRDSLVAHLENALLKS